MKFLYKSSAQGFTTIFSYDEQKTSKIKNEVVSEGVNELYRTILKFPGNRIPFYAEKMEVPEKTLERWIKQLRDEDKIEFRGSPKTGGYFLL